MIKVELEFKNEDDLKLFLKTIESDLDTIEYVEKAYNGGKKYFDVTPILISIKNQLKEVVDD